MTEPTEVTGDRPRLAVPSTRNPFLDMTEAGKRIRADVARAVESIAPRGAALKISNIVLRLDGTVDAKAIVIEVRAP